MIPQINMQPKDFSKCDAASNVNNNQYNSDNGNKSDKPSFKDKLHKELNKSEQIISKEKNNIEIEDKDVIKDSNIKEPKEDCQKIAEELVNLLSFILNDSKKEKDGSLKSQEVAPIIEVSTDIIKEDMDGMMKLREFLNANKLELPSAIEKFLKEKDVTKEVKDLLSIFNKDNEELLLDDKVKTLIEKTMNKFNQPSNELKIKETDSSKNIIYKIKELINFDEKITTNKIDSKIESIKTSNLDQETISKDEKFLNNLLDKDNSYKNTKALMFGTMNNEKPDNEKPSISSNMHLPLVEKVPLTNIQTLENIKEPVVINKNSMVEDVIKNIKFMETANIKELTVKINPKDLGEIVIRLSLENNEIKARILSGNKETFNMLNSNLNEIKNNLAAQNLRVNDVSVDVYLQDSTTYSEFKEGKGEEQGNKQNLYKPDQNSGDVLDDVSDYESSDIYKDNSINILA